MKHLKRFTCMAMAAAMALSLAACGGTPSDAGGSGSEAGSGDQKTIVVGTSNFTEVNILGEIYTELIEANTDYEVEQRFGLSGAAMCFDALEQGSIDMFVEYTGTALLNLLAQPMDTDKDRVWQTVHDLMLEEHGIQTSNPLGYNNTYVMSVKPETAEKYGLTSLSDLIEKSPELRLGCTVEFMDREDCLPLLESKYGSAVQAGPHHAGGRSELLPALLRCELCGCRTPGVRPRTGRGAVQTGRCHRRGDHGCHERPSGRGRHERPGGGPPVPGGTRPSD